MSLRRALRLTITAPKRLHAKLFQRGTFVQQVSPASTQINSSSANSSSGTPSATADSGKVNFPTDPNLPGEHFEVRQTHPAGDLKPDPSKSIPISKPRKELLDDIIALYEMKPTIRRVERYTPDCVYNDQFVYANDRYKTAGQWFGLPKLFRAAKSHGYQVVTNDRDLIQFRHEEEWHFKIIPKIATINAVISLSLDPGSIDSDFIRVKYHKDQANDKDYSNEGLGATFKKWQADNVAKHMDSPEVEHFKADERAGKTERKTYGTGKEEGDVAVKDL